VSPELAARLAAHRIELLSEARGFSLLARESCFALVNLAEGRVPGIGSPGMMTENGLAYLVWRQGEPRLVAKGSDMPATAAEVAAIRRFSEDLKTALTASG
jgi:hypothetical protein